MRRFILGTAALSMSLAGAAFADTAAKAGTDLNLRSGPGVQHEIIGTIKGGDDVAVKGCIESANWCEVSYDGKDGWAYGDYLAAKVGEEFKAIYPNRQELKVTAVEYKDNSATPTDTAVGAGTGAAMGALIAGPLGAVVGAAIGGTAANVTPPDEVKTYVTTNQVEGVLLDGEVVTGAGVPEAVTLYDIPDHADYKYAVINGQTVLISPETRKIVYIYR